jgi:ubiquinone/menaquinone biosynthesis C-methylase UbiE
MSKPVDKLEFWKDRIENAKKGREHYSVFISNESTWKDINEKHKDILDKEIKETDNVIDLGCAYGRSSEMVKGKYTGVDFSPDFIEKAKSKYPDKKFLVANLKELPFKDKKFDIGFMVSIKAMIVSNLGNNEWEKIEKECKRVCKKLLILEYGQGDKDIKNDAEHYEII